MAFFKRTVKDTPVRGKTVLVRADYNVPLTEKGEIDSDFRIRASLPTIKYLLSQNCKVVIISHLGRPKGREKSLSLEPVAERLAELLGRPVTFVTDCIGDKVSVAVKKAPKTSVLLLENLRYYPEEEANSVSFAREIATRTGARDFVQDGFGVVHRAHASTDAITQFIPGIAGLLLEKEYNTITSAMSKPKRPLVAVMGGAKINDKMPLIERFVSVADRIVVGGAMANTFLSYKGYEIGKSVAEKSSNQVLDNLYSAAHDKTPGHADDFIMLPCDVAVSDKFSSKAKRRVVDISKVKKSDIILDVGDKTIESIVKEVAGAGTVIWNGTLGYTDYPEFSHGSARLALKLATSKKTHSIICGGDTASFTVTWDGGSGESFTHVSTGGGASLELMAGLKLPGVESLLDA